MNDDKQIVILKNVRLSYPKLFTPSKFNENSDLKYEANFVLNLEEHASEIAKVQRVIDMLTKDTFKGKVLPADQLCMKEKDGDNFEGCLVVHSSAQATQKPVLLAQDLSELTDEISASSIHQNFYGGCRVNAKIRIWALNKLKVKKWICAQVLAVQFVKDDEAFGVHISHDVAMEGFDASETDSILE